MSLLSGYDDVKAAPRGGHKVGRRLAPAPVLIGRGTAHAMTDLDARTAACGVEVRLVENVPFGSGQLPLCVECQRLTQAEPTD